MSRPATDSAAWELLDRLRPMPQPPSAFVVPLAVMVYLRWADFQEAEAEAMAAFDDSDYTPLLPASLHWRCWHELLTSELPEFFSQRLASALAKLGGSHDPLAASLFRLVPALRFMGEISPAGLAALAGWLATQLFETPYDRRMLLEHFDSFVDASVSRESGEFRTPANINELLVALAHPGTGERLYDPCFGFGGILTAACQNVSRTEKSNFTRNGAPDLQIAGMDINLNAFAVTLARLALMGVATPQLEIGNSLEREAFGSPQKQGFDLVITSPPWGQRIENTGLDHFPIRTTDSTSLFVQHALSQLRPKGRAIVVVPQGFLFQQGKTASLRQWLLERHHVDAVINLPVGAFLPYTAIKAAVLVLTRDGGPTRKVRMVDGTAFFEPNKGKTAAFIKPERIEELTADVLAHHPSAAAWDAEADMVAELGFDLTPTRREISEFEQILESLGKEIPVHPLQQLCELSGGRAIPSAKLSANPIGNNPIPYIRIGDIQRGQTTKSSSWLTLESASDYSSRHRLRAGDVLVSKSGTIGKTGVVRNGAVGGIASGGFIVLRPDTSQIDPHFLAAYLQSSDCQQWLKSKSSGSVISGLQKHFIETLPVPLPPLQIQHRVATDVREQQVDALKQLQSIISQRDSDPLSIWLDRALHQIDEAGPRRAAREVMKRVFGADLRAVLFQANRNPDTASILVPWVRTLHKFSDLYWNLDTIPRGPSFLNVLQQVESELGKAEQQIKGNSLIESNARTLNRLCLEILREKMDELLAEVLVTIEVKSITAVTGTKAEVSLSLSNESPLPLWNFTLKCAEWGLDVEPFYFPENEIREITLEVEPPAIGESCPMRIEWSGTTTAGEKEGDTVEIFLKVEVETLQAASTADLGFSPYFISQPVGPDRNDVFFGREDLIAQIKRQLQSGNTVLLEGNRRAGKSSILKHLEGDNRIPGFLAVYSSFQGTSGNNQVSGMKSDAVWRSLAQSIASGVATLGIDTPLPDGSILKAGSDIGIAKASRKGISEDAPWEDFQDYLATILKLLRSMDRGMVLMIDEFDKLQEGIDNGVTSPQIPENIRYLIQTMPRFAAIMTGSRRMQRLRNEYWSALYGLGNRIGVTALDPKAAKMLVTEPVKGRLAYTDEAANLVVELTARQPYIIQYLCNTIFELANFKEQRSITASLVQEAARTFVEANEHFATLWGYVETDRRRFLISLIHRESRNPDPITFGLIKERLAGKGIELSDADLDHDLKFLQELELIDYLGAGGGGRYQLTIPLMREWLDSQQDHDALLAMALDEQQNSQ
jgi:type I restriction enzyme M protein